MDYITTILQVVATLEKRDDKGFSNSQLQFKVAGK
jgi:hypothetical protein